MMYCFPLMVSKRRESKGTAAQVKDIRHKLQASNKLFCFVMIIISIKASYLYTKIQPIVMKIKDVFVFVGMIFALPMLAQESTTKVSDGKPVVMVMDIKAE